MKPLILASSSPYRKELLSRLQLPFTCHSPDIDESPLNNESPRQRSQRLAQQKALALASIYPQHWIIGSDQVAALGALQLGKPNNAANAIAQLSQSSGQQVNFYTSVTVFDSQQQRFFSDTDITSVLFRSLSLKQIQHYVATEKPFNCAGSFKVEGLGISLFEEVNTTDPSALIGLPLIKLTSLLAKHGFDLLNG